MSSFWDYIGKCAGDLFKLRFFVPVRVLNKNRYCKIILISSFSAVFVLVIFGFSFFYFNKGKIDQKSVIKPVVIKTTQTVVVGYPVKWTMLVKKSQIKNGQYLVQLPKGAKNIKIQTVNAKQAQDIFKAKPAGMWYSEQTQQENVAKRAGFVGSVIDAAETVVDAISQQMTQAPENTYIDLSSQAIEPPSEQMPFQNL